LSEEVEELDSDDDEEELDEDAGLSDWACDLYEFELTVVLALVLFRLVELLLLLLLCWLALSDEI
jgi:hypothetical protein